MDKKELFSVQFNYTWNNYVKLIYKIPYGLLFKYIFYLASSFIIFTLLLMVDYRNSIFESIRYCLIIVFVLIIFCFLTLKWLLRKVYDYYNKHQGISNLSEQVYFYKDYFIKKTKDYDVKIKYKDIEKVIETKYIFELDNCSGDTVYLLKDELSEENLEFIRNINKKNYKKIEKKKEFMEEVYNPSCLKGFSKVFKILFVMTFISFILPNIVFLIYSSTSNIPMDFLLVKLENCYDPCCCFSIISIILAIKYFKNIKFVKVNLISSIVFFIILFTIVGLFVPLTKDIDYKNVKKYEDILNIRLPKTGEYFQYDELENEKNKKDILIIEGYYKDLKDKEKVELNINEGNNWITYKKAKKELGQFLIDNLKNKTCNDCYVLVYNKKRDEYNNKNINKETDSILVAFYNKEENHLFINEYKFKEFIEIKTDIQEAIDGFENNDYKDEDFDDSKTRTEIKIEFEI